MMKDGTLPLLSRDNSPHHSSKAYAHHHPHGSGAATTTYLWLKLGRICLGQSGRPASVRRCILLLVFFCVISGLYLSYHVSSIHFHM